MSQAHLSVLVQLARADGEVAEQELQLIKQIGQANGLPSEMVQAAIENPVSENDIDFEVLTNDERFEYIYSLVQLMKADGKLYQEEIRFTAQMAARLGYDEAVLFELITRVYSDPHINTEKHKVKAEVQQYLKQA